MHRNAGQSGMAKNPPSIRSIAAALGLSRTTVSDALRGVGRVDPSTAKQIERHAAKVGYRANPLTGSVMSAMRRGRARAFRGSLAVVDIAEPGHMPHGPFHGEIIAGLRTRSEDLGFSVEEFVAGPTALPLQRLDGILQSRGIHGVVVLPSWYAPDLAGLKWENYAGIYTDYVIERPSLHSVCADHYHLIITALETAKRRGYKRPGMIMQVRRDERIELRQTAAFRAFQATHFTDKPVPLLIRPEEPALAADFPAWFARHEPDVVLSHFEQTLDWMKACGARVPHTHGFIALNVIACRRPVAGLDLQGRMIGSRAADMLIGQILRNERGLPEWPSRTVLAARWVEGPTVRSA
jgi:LacI family transcriptional regulator